MRKGGETVGRTGREEVGETRRKGCEEEERREGRDLREKTECGRRRGEKNKRE